MSLNNAKAKLLARRKIVAFVADLNPCENSSNSLYVGGGLVGGVGRSGRFCD